MSSWSQHQGMLDTARPVQSKQNPTYADQSNRPLYHRHQPAMVSEVEKDRHWSMDIFHFINERIDSTLANGCVTSHWVGDEQARLFLSNRPANLDHTVIHRYNNIEKQGVSYRFDNIIYQDRFYLRIVRDDEETIRRLKEATDHLYKGLVHEEQLPELADVIRDIFNDVTKDSTQQVLDAIALLKKKDTKQEPTKKVDDGMDHLRTSEARQAAAAREPLFTPPVEPDLPKPFYNNVYFVGLIAERFIVHNHPTLGFLVAL